MLRKYASTVIQKADETFKDVVKKRVHFNEENVRETHHPAKKDYGFMNIPEAKTPFPRHDNPVAAEELRARLQEALDKANRNLYNSFDDQDYITLKSFNLNDLRTPLDSVASDSEERKREEFYKKRKQFNQSEFTITKEYLMSREIPEPGPAVENWRIDPGSANNTVSNLTLFMSQNQLLRENSFIDYEALREIAKQSRNY